MTAIKNIIIALILALSVSGLSLADMTPVDLNSATVEQLAETLHGVGESKAKAIVAYRDENGNFEHVDELVNVRGIGLRTVDRNRGRITLGQSDSD